MADLAVWQRTIVDEKGDIIPGAEVSVRSYPGGSLITLYEGPDGVQVKGNPFSTGADGFARFWAESQRAEIVAHGAGSTIRWIVDLINADEVIGDAVSEATAAAADAVSEAKAEADRAEAARDAAQLNAGIYPDTAAGLAATSDGDYFSVPSPDDDEYLILYRNDSGVAVEVARYPSIGGVETLAALSRRGGDISAVANAVDARAGDIIGRYTDVLAGGDISNRPQITYSRSLLAGGTAILISMSGGGERILALRNMVPLASGQMIEVLADGNSSPGFPVIGSYEVGVAWYDNEQKQLPGGDAETVFRTIPEITGSSYETDRFTIGRSAPFADVQAPINARYAIPFIRLTASSGTWVVTYFQAKDADLRFGLDAIRAWALSLDTPPTNLRLSATEVDKDAPIGTVVGLLSVFDPDPAGAPAYTLVNDAGGLFAIERDRVVVASSLSTHEGEHTIRVRAVDWFGRQVERSLVLQVVDDLFTPASLPEALFVLDTEFFTDAAGTVPASVGDRVRYVRDNAGGLNFFTTPSSSRSPWLRADENGRLYLENPEGDGIQQRLSSDAPILPDSKEWYFGIVGAADDSRYVPLFSQRSFTSYGDPGNFQIQLNSNWGTSGGTGVVFPERALAFIQGATDGFSAPSTGPGNGQPRNGFLETGKPILIEVIAREGHLASEVRFNGLLHDRFTMNENTAQEVCWILNNQGTGDGGNCRLYSVVALGSVPDLDIISKIRRWLMRRGGIDLGYDVGGLPRIWSPRAIALAPDGIELASLNPDELASPASMAKAMSALTAFRLLDMLDSDEASALDTLFEVTEGDTNVSGTSANLQGGDIVSLRDLLYGMALPSGNDAARCVARVFGGMLKELDGDSDYSVAEARSRFVAEMNAVSADIGLVGATWTNPIGGSDARVSARHCAQMFRVLIEEYPTAADIFSAQNHTMTVTGPNARTYDITSTNALLQRGETWAEASKTGTLSGWGASAVLSWQTDTGETIVQVNMGASLNGMRWGDQQVIRDVVLRDWRFIDGEPVPTR